MGVPFGRRIKDLGEACFLWVCTFQRPPLGWEGVPSLPAAFRQAEQRDRALEELQRQLSESTGQVWAPLLPPPPRLRMGLRPVLPAGMNVSGTGRWNRFAFSVINQKRLFCRRVGPHSTPCSMPAPLLLLRNTPPWENVPSLCTPNLTFDDL